MKKIILAIFLILGAVSFAAPKYVDMAKLQKNSYQIIQDEEGAFLFGKSTEDVGLTVALFEVSENKDVAKKMSEEVKTTAPADQKYISSRENKRTLYITNKDFKVNQLDKIADQTLNEIESYLK